MACMFYFAHCINIIFNSLLAQLVKYAVHTTRKIKFIHAIFYHILLFVTEVAAWVTTKYLPSSGSSPPAMLTCGQPRNRKITTPTMNPHVAKMISLTAPTGVSFNRDMMRPPPKLPRAPASDHDSAANQPISQSLVIITREEATRHNEITTTLTRFHSL